MTRKYMPSTHKKVIVRKMDRDTVSGYVSPEQFVHEGKLELLNTSGTVISMDLREIKGRVLRARVRRFGVADAQDVYFSSAIGRAVGAAAVQRQRNSGRPDARRPDADDARRISGQPSRPALEHAAHLRAAYGAGVANGVGGNRSDAAAAPRSTGSAPSTDVRRVNSQ